MPQSVPNISILLFQLDLSLCGRLMLLTSSCSILLTRIVAAIQILGFGTAAAACDDFICTSQSSASDALRSYREALCDEFKDEYGRQPNEEGLHRILAFNRLRPVSDLLILSLPLAGACIRVASVEPHSETVKQQPAEVEAPYRLHEVVLPPRGTASLHYRNSSRVKMCGCCSRAPGSLAA
jgi:hypothetical protein